MSLRNDMVLPQDLSDEDVTAVVALMTPETVGEPTRRLYTESGYKAKLPIAAVEMSDSDWTTAIPLVATAMYDTDNS